MIRDLNARAEAKGYTIEKEPVSFSLPLIGTFTLPLWMDFERIYISPKHRTRYTIHGLIRKFQEKRERRAQRRRKELFGILLKSGIHPQNPYSFK